MNICSFFPLVIPGKEWKFPLNDWYRFKKYIWGWIEKQKPGEEEEL